MQNLTEEYLAELFSSSAVDLGRFNALASPNRGEFIIPSSRLMGDPQYLEPSGITERLHRLWDCNGINLNIHMQMEDGVISNIRIHKYREGSGGAGHPIIRDLVPDQQELRIVRRILEYITN